MFLDFYLTDNTVAYVFDGPMDAKVINQLKQQIENKLVFHERINIYLEDRGIDHFTLYSVIVGVIFPLQHHNRFNKVAMVTDRSWIHLLSTINSTLISAEIRNYHTENREDAMDWIREE